MFKWWVYHCDTIPNQWGQPSLSVLDWLPVLQQLTHSHEASQLSKTAFTLTSPNRSIPKAISAEMSSHTGNQIHSEDLAKSPSGVEGQQQSHHADKDEWQTQKRSYSHYTVLLGMCYCTMSHWNVTVWQIPSISEQSLTYYWVLFCTWPLSLCGWRKRRKNLSLMNK